MFTYISCIPVLSHTSAVFLYIHIRPHKDTPIDIATAQAAGTDTGAGTGTGADTDT